MASQYARSLLRIASELSDPLLGYELERAVFAIEGRRFSVVNPGVRTFEEQVEDLVAVLKSLRQELRGALDEFETADEFSKFFTDGFAEEEELQRMMDGFKELGRSKSAGVGDFLKNLFKKKPADEEDSPGMSPTYELDDSAMDDFVEGSREWDEATKYIESEYADNREFFGGANQVVEDIGGLKRAPTKPGIQKLIKKVEDLISQGEKLAKGIRSHLEPSRVFIDDEDTGRETLKEGKPAEEPPGVKVDDSDTGRKTVKDDGSSDPNFWDKDPEVKPKRPPSPKKGPKNKGTEKDSPVPRAPEKELRKKEKDETENLPPRGAPKPPKPPKKAPKQRKPTPKPPKKETPKPITIEDDGIGEGKKAPARKKLKGDDLDNVVTHYTDMLKESVGDEKKTLRYLKELFAEVGPLVESDRASLAAARRRALSAMVRMAHARPNTRRVLLPIIRLASGR